MIKQWEPQVEMMHPLVQLQWPPKVGEFGPLLVQCPQLELQALMMREGQVEAEVEVPGGAESSGEQQSVGPNGHAFQPSAGIEQNGWW